MTLSDFAALKALPLPEKLNLLDELWQAISSELDQMPVSDEEKQVLERRWSRYLQDPAAALTVEQFKAHVDALRN